MTADEFRKKYAAKYRGRKAADLEKACLHALQLRGFMAWKNHTTGIYDPRIGRYRSTSARNGAPDILAVKDGRLYCIEIKLGKDRLTPAQQEFLNEAHEHGAVTWVIRSIDQLLQHLESLSWQRASSNP